MFGIAPWADASQPGWPPCGFHRGSNLWCCNSDAWESHARLAGGLGSVCGPVDGWVAQVAIFGLAVAFRRLVLLAFGDPAPIMAVDILRHHSHAN